MIELTEKAARQAILSTYLENNPACIELKHWIPVKIVGENAESFLQGQLTCDVTKITAEQASLSALCNHQGRVLAIFVLVKRGQDYYCILPGTIADDFIKHLTKFAVFSRVNLSKANPAFIYAYLGSNAVSLLQQKFEKLPQRAYEVYSDEQQLVLNISSLTPLYLLWQDQPLKGEVSEQDLGWKLVSILSGQPAIYSETKAVATPHMLNLPALDAVSFNKGCYVGQEIIARTHYLGKSKRHLWLAAISSELMLTPGESIYSDGQEVGVLIDSVSIAGATIALVILQDPIDRTFMIQGLQLQCFPL